MVVWLVDRVESCRNIFQFRSLAIFSAPFPSHGTDATAAYLQAREYATYNRDAEVPQKDSMQAKAGSRS